jgi:hypothetical protein
VRHHAFYTPADSFASLQDMGRVSQGGFWSTCLGSLELFEADLLTAGTFDDAVSGAHYVFHTASPFFIKVSVCKHACLHQDPVQQTSCDPIMPAVLCLDGCSRMQPVCLLQPDNDPHKELIEPAVHGTKNVLQSVARSKNTVKRVVLTSSVAGTLLDALDACP